MVECCKSLIKESKALIHPRTIYLFLCHHGFHSAVFFSKTHSSPAELDGCCIVPHTKQTLSANEHECAWINLSHIYGNFIAGLCCHSRSSLCEGHAICTNVCEGHTCSRNRNSIPTDIVKMYQRWLKKAHDRSFCMLSAIIYSNHMKTIYCHYFYEAWSIKCKDTI